MLEKKKNQSEQSEQSGYQTIVIQAKLLGGCWSHHFWL